MKRFVVSEEVARVFRLLYIIYLCLMLPVVTFILVVVALDILGVIKV